MDESSSALPDVLAGPLLRRIEPQRVVLWLASSRPLAMRLRLFPGDQAPRDIALDEDACQCLAIGVHAYVQLIDIALPEPLPCDVAIGYDLLIHQPDGGLSNGAPSNDAPSNDAPSNESEAGIAHYCPHLLYGEEANPSFVIKSRLDGVLHGSCRKPHYPTGDGLARADAWLAERHDQPAERPALLLMTGDQIYADDVAGPMLAAIHALIQRLGLYGEFLEGAMVDDSDALYADKTYYRRQQLLPEFESNETLRERFFGGVKKPIFTTANASNHLITFSEVMAMYLLVWSPLPWRLIEYSVPPLDDVHAKRFAAEREIIEAFVSELPAAARVMAQVPTLMIFDDHDITDDWNLSAAWEETVYGHPFSRRIVGNALIGYLICQGWGNAPDRLSEPLDRFKQLLGNLSERFFPAAQQDELITDLLRFEGWSYCLPCLPKLVVLDTRTQRWRSERNRQLPSGLMDWEALSEFQQELIGESSILIVSPAPMFGVKLIEGVQRLFSWVGKPLLVDAENWMAHRGAASVLLNIFRHTRTPRNYVILSGDVHYSFVYDVRIRQQRERGPSIWQITSSGLKNEFPDTLLDWFDRLNRWLYAPWSPLNWFTKRRKMHVRPRIPDHAKASERVWNGAGIGYVRLDDQGRPSEVMQIGNSGVTVRFERDRQDRPG